MKQRYWLWLISFILIAVVPAAAQRRYILRAPAEAVDVIAARQGLTVVRALLDRPGKGIFLVTAPENIPPGQVIRSARLDPAVVNFELDAAAVLPETSSGIVLNQSTVGILDALGDPVLVTYYGSTVWGKYPTQPAAGIIGIDTAQQRFGPGLGTIAVIDTGVDPDHVVLSGSLVPGYDFVHNQPGMASEMTDVNQSTVAILDQGTGSVLNSVPVVVNQSTVAILDQSTVGILDTSTLPAAFGHGTMVSGLVHLVAPTATIMPLKAFSSDGTAYLFNIISAIYFAVDNGAKAINMSFSMDASSTELQAAISYANSNRVICLASVGNSGIETIVYPAGYQKVIGNASTSNSDVRSVFSNYGSVVSVAAPGEGLLTAYPGDNYAAVWGTSFSVALNSGGVGLLVQIGPNINQAQALDSFSQAYPIPNQGLGAGRIDLYRACERWQYNNH